MTKIEKSDGSVVNVDTIFYSFKKGVFQYLTLQSTTASIASLGLYTEKNDSLFLNVNTYQATLSDWGEGVYTRDYKVEKQSSTKLILNYQEDLYHFRKY